MKNTESLKAPFPYFGGKSLAAPVIWSLLGDVSNYMEPFAGSLAVLLSRPSPVRGSETVNDWSCHLINAWRAIQANPTELAKLLAVPVSEVNAEAQHSWLICNASDLRSDLGDPDFFDVRAAAYYISGACAWIGSGYASGEGPWSWSKLNGWEKPGKGINRQLPHLGNHGKGINRQLPHLGDHGVGINRQLPHLGDHGVGEVKLRTRWVEQWLSALSDRLSAVRITCGDWKRIAESRSARMDRRGPVGIFLDPPYDSTEYVYGKDQDVSLSAQCNEFAIKYAGASNMRIIIAGRGDEHDNLIDHGYKKQNWKCRRGYSRGSHGSPSKEEALWSSPSCLIEATSKEPSLSLSDD